MRLSILLIAQIILINTGICGGIIIKEKRNLFILSVGIDKYKKPFQSYFSCEQDAIKFNNKFTDDFKSFDDVNNSRWGIKGEVFSFVLTNENANKDSIKKVFDFIALNSKPQDIFIFSYAGISYEDDNGETSLIPYLEKEFDTFNPSLIASEIISLNAFSKWANNIQCNSQLYISESGSGEDFATNLIKNLFESNIILAQNSKRERIIITTKGLGYDSYKCQNDIMKTGGPLCYFIMNTSNIMHIFQNQSVFEFEILKAEIECNPFRGEKIYSAIYNERQFNKMLVNKFKSRGAEVYEGEDTEEKSKNTPTKNHAILIATDEYNDASNWEKLKNPINDAKAVQSILKNKYKFETLTLYNMTLDSVLMEVIKYKENIGLNDNVLFFFAGHGYYDKEYSDCFVVFKDSKPLKEDFRRNTYFQMASLNRFLDNFPNKNLFVIFDICFGAYFDLNAKELSLSDYKDVSFDISLDEFIKRKGEYMSRIYLSSGKGEVPDYWSNSLNHSPFAKKLIEALEKENLFLTPGKIYKYLEGNITEPYLKQFGKHDTRGDFIMRVN